MAHLELLCTTKNNMNVYYDPVDSHAATHLADTPGLKDLVGSVLAEATLDVDLLETDVDMQRIIGNSDVVAVDSSDDIVYAVRKNRDTGEYVPFTKSRESEPSTHLSYSVTKQDKDSYILNSTWIGIYETPPFPLADNANNQSISYWNSHAFVWGSQEIMAGSETSACPW